MSAEDQAARPLSGSGGRLRAAMRRLPRAHWWLVGGGACAALAAVTIVLVRPPQPVTTPVGRPAPSANQPTTTADPLRSSPAPLQSSSTVVAALTAKPAATSAGSTPAAPPPTPAAPATAAAAPPTPPISTYTVQSGDTLSHIALRFGTDVPSLEVANKLTARSIIHVGQRLTVLDQVGWIWTVTSGETLARIASQTGTTVAKLEQANHLSSAMLRVGQQLVIPQEPSASQVAGLTAPATSTARSNGVWVVRSGDTLGLIASTEGVSLASLEVANGLTGSSILRIGETITVPGGTAPTTTSGIRLSWPVPTFYRITSPFGWRQNPWGPGRDFHHGIDIGVPLMTPVHAACSGIVKVAAWITGFRGGYGNAVEILCNSGPLTLYAHNTKLVVHVGEAVSQGQLISYSGSTGNSTGPHLHFGVKVNGTWENPMDFLPPR